jgi:hypothetical protein
VEWQGAGDRGQRRRQGGNEAGGNEAKEVQLEQLLSSEIKVSCSPGVAISYLKGKITLDEAQLREIYRQTSVTSISFSIFYYFWTQ